ncbi:MAG: hypothetical protein Fur0023_08260 [Bacteroidia bacterium]
MSDNEGFKKLSDAFKELLHNKGLEDKIRKAKVLSMWKDVVGPHIANNTFNLRFEGNKLLVNVKSDALKNELMFMRHQIIQNIHQVLKEEFIEDIIFY